MTKLTHKLPTIARLTLGLAFFVFGLNGFLHFLPQPPAPAAAASLIGAMIGSGYLLAFVKATEVLVGALLLLDRFVPLALAILAPVMLNIVAFHAFLAPAGLALPIVLVGLQLYLAWAYRAAFSPMLQVRTAPSEELAPLVATMR